MDAGVALGQRLDGGAHRYQQMRFVAERCPVDGGFAVGVPVDDAGWPLFAVVVRPHPCAWRPAGTLAALCLLIDAGDPGDENTMACVEVAGEDSRP
jgi:hypothetical protein